MERDALSLRQLMVLFLVSLLSPASELLPAWTAGRAGSAGWLSGLAALPLLLLSVWAAGGLGRSAPERPGPLGSAAVLIGLLWTLLTLSWSLRLCGARLAALYGEAPAFGCVLALLSVAVWMGLGKTAALARAGEIFYLALSVALAGVLVLSAFHVEWDNLRPTGAEWAALPGGGAAAAGLLLNLTPAAALARKVPPAPGGSRRAAGWTAAFCAALTLLLAAVSGCVGPRLTARLDAPFLILVQGLGVRGVFQRVEALVSALWSLSDLTLFGLLLHTWRELAGRLRPGAWCRWSTLPAAALALAGGYALLAPAQTARAFCGKILPALGLVLGLLLPLLSRGLARLRRRGT